MSSLPLDDEAVRDALDALPMPRGAAASLSASASGAATPYRCNSSRPTGLAERLQYASSSAMSA